jgi:glycosyltransferase involved in cell wall biosynthesis
VFTDYFFPELGGIQDSIATISRALGARGHHVDIFAPRYGARDYARIGAAPVERDLGANVRIRRRASLPFPSSTRQSRAAAPSLLGWTQLTLQDRPDVIHVHSFFGIGLEALLNGAMLKIPVVGTNHTTIAGFAGHIPVSVARASAFVLWFYNRCQYVTAPSRSVFDELGVGALYPPRSVISNPIDTGLFKPADGDARAALRARFGLSGPVITYAGRLAPEKNITVLLQAVALLKQHGIIAQLAIAGHGSHEAILRDLADELTIVGQVKFLGTLAQQDLTVLLQASDIFAIMSTSETQSMVLLQAMACGLPVIGANTRALPDFIGPDNGLLADPHDPADISAAMAHLLADPARRQTMGEAGRQRAARFGVDAVADEWERLYERVLDGRKGA